MSTAVNVGIDVGGTASRWVACDAAGEVVARGKVAGATAHVFNPAEREKLTKALSTIAAELAEKDLRAEQIAAGLTGYGPGAAGDVGGLITATLGVAADAVLLADDMTLAYASIFAPGEGHLVSAGTGSIGLHIDQAGTLVRVGGRGILIDDAGSGSWIALRALDRLYRCLDHTGSFDDVALLAKELFALVGGNEWHDVRALVYGGDRGRIGALAVGVGRAAEGGDGVALSLLAEAGRELAALVTALTARAGKRRAGFIGGVLKLHPVLVDEIRKSLPEHEVIMPEVDAALGAARLFTNAQTEWRTLLSN